MPKPVATELLPVAREPAPLPAISTGDPQEILRFAIEKGAAVDVIERVMAVRRELRAEQAQAAFESAMAAFQAECPAILKEKGVPDRTGRIAYRYSPLEFIATQIKPLLEKHGLSYSFDQDTASEPGWVIAKCIVTHRLGHSRTSSSKFPLGTKTQIMSDTQQYAAALTFANRRVLVNAFGLVLAGEDMDGATGKLKPQGPSSLQPDESTLKQLAKEIWVLLKPVRGSAQNWNEANAWLWKEEVLDPANPDEAMPHLKADRMRQIIPLIKEKLRA